MQDRIVVWKIKQADRPNYKLEWLDSATGRRKSISAKTADAEAAEKARNDLEYELNHGTYKEKSKTTWKDFRDAYDREKLAAGRDGSRKKAGYVFKSFEKFAAPKTLGQITSRTVSTYAAKLRDLDMAKPTIHGHLSYLRAAFRWAVGQGMMTELPKFEMPDLPKKIKIRKISAEEFERLLLKAPSVEWRALIAIAWYTGMRRNEILALTWNDRDRPHIDFGEARVRIPAAFNKSDDDQWIPLHPELADILREVPNRAGNLFSFAHLPNEASRTFGVIAKAAGFKITLHDLRRSFGSRYAAVVPAQVLQRLMRHANIATTLKFYTEIDDHLEAAILKA